MVASVIGALATIGIATAGGLLGLTLWLHEQQHKTILEAKGDLSGEIHEVRADVRHLSGKVDSLGSKVDQILGALGLDAQP